MIFGKKKSDKDTEQVNRAESTEIVKVHEKTDTPVLSFGDLDVQFATEFGRVHAVRGVDIDIHPGEVVALVGESGSGKSVTSMSALGLLPGNAKVEGEISVAGTRSAACRAGDGVASAAPTSPWCSRSP